MSKIPTFIPPATPRSDSALTAYLEQLASDLAVALAAVKEVTDDHEDRITALEP